MEAGTARDARGAGAGGAPDSDPLALGSMPHGMGRGSGSDVPPIYSPSGGSSGRVSGLPGRMPSDGVTSFGVTSASGLGTRGPRHDQATRRGVSSPTSRIGSPESMYPAGAGHGGAGAGAGAARRYDSSESSLSYPRSYRMGVGPADGSGSHAQRQVTSTTMRSIGGATVDMMVEPVSGSVMSEAGAPHGSLQGVGGLGAHSVASGSRGQRVPTDDGWTSARMDGLGYDVHERDGDGEDEEDDDGERSVVDDLGVTSAREGREIEVSRGTASSGGVPSTSGSGSGSGVGVGMGRRGARLGRRRQVPGPDGDARLSPHRSAESSTGSVPGVRAAATAAGSSSGVRHVSALHGGAPHGGDIAAPWVGTGGTTALHTQVGADVPRLGAGMSRGVSMGSLLPQPMQEPRSH